jgi:hypothetical protein
MQFWLVNVFPKYLNLAILSMDLFTIFISLVLHSGNETRTYISCFSAFTYISISSLTPNSVYVFSMTLACSAHKLPPPEWTRGWCASLHFNPSWSSWILLMIWDPEVRPLVVRPFASSTILNSWVRPRGSQVQPNSSLFSYGSAPSLFIQLDFKVVWCASFRNCSCVFVLIYCNIYFII